MSANSLSTANSPYLRLHADNPVHWRLWNEETLAEAKAADKPIFLSLGYTGCHWCHVMNRESFSDPDTAALLNEHFIPVLVDREERPDLDAIYQAAAQMMGYAGGWPLSIFLTPDQAPYFVTGYVAKDETANAISFKQLLVQTSAIYKEKRADAEHNATQLRARLEDLFNRDMRAEIESIALDLASLRAAQRFDIFFGGVQGQTKFPNPVLTESVWRAWLRTGVPQYSQIVFVTLDNVLFSGLYDHIGGGFFRYTTDERWLLPHFEKMLYDSALMVNLMTLVWQQNRNELCRMRVEGTIGWMLREMRVGDAFATSIAPDSEDEEGRFYLWSEAEIDAALQGTFSAKFKQLFGVTRDGNYKDGRNILRRLGRAQGTSEADESMLTKQRELLLAARDKRKRPMRDDKVLADWNGLAIAAIAKAGAAFEKPEWINAAIKAFYQVSKDLGGEDGRLQHCRGVAGFADDYANMAEAALVLFEVTGDQRFLEPARQLVDTMNDSFWNEAVGGYAFTTARGEATLVRPRTVADQPTPAANGTMITVLCKMALIFNEPAYGARTAQLVSALAEEAGRLYMSAGAFLNGIEYFSAVAQILVVGPKQSAKTQDLLRTIWGKSFPNKLVRQLESTDELPEGHPARGKPMEGGVPTAYVVQRNQVSPPITSAVTLSQALTMPFQPQAEQRGAMN